MNKRLIIIVSAITIIILATVGLYYLTNKPTDSGINNISSKDSGITKDNYYVEKGLESLAGATKLAVENYASQNQSESADARSKRLAKYFTADSQVYGYTQENIGASVLKSSAKATSITSCEEQEGGDWCLLVMVDTKLYFKDETKSVTQTYWITLSKAADGSYKPDDIGSWQ